MLTKLASNKLLVNILLVASGAAGAQAITMAFAPFITRLYGPEAFGIQGTFIAVLATLTPIVALTYPIAIVLPRSDKQAVELAKLSIMIALLVSAIIAVLLFLYGDVIASFLKIEVIESFLWLLPCAMLMAAIQQVLSQWYIRKGMFSAGAKIAIWQALSVNLSKVSIGLINPTAMVLVVISALANGIHALYLFWGSKEKYKTISQSIGLLDNKSNFSSRLGLVVKYKDFALYRTPQVFLNALSQSIPVILLSAFFGPLAAGYYTLSKLVLGLPSMLIGKSIQDVFYPEIAHSVREKKEFLPLLIKSTLLMAIIGIFPFGVVVAYGPLLFSFVFGIEWSVAGEYACLLSIWLYFGFLNRPSVASISVLGLERFFLIYELMSVAVRVFALFIGFKLYESDRTAVMLFSLVGALLNIFLIYKVILRAANVEKNRVDYA